MLEACHNEDAPDFDNDLYGNFDCLAYIIDSRYCFFQEKDIDWHAITATYRKEITPGMTQMEFFDLCASMLDELKDGHTNLISRFNTSYYREWWSLYPQDFDLRTLQQYYLSFNWMQTSGITYAILDGNIGYMYYPSFSDGISETSLDYILAYLYKTDGLIIDIRDNGGGLLPNVNVLASRLIEQDMLQGYISHKTGPGHNEFSEPYAFTLKAAGSERIKYTGKPVALLTNRSCYSAANSFAAVMKAIPQVTLIGALTGGGGGMPMTQELPNGWSVRYSASQLYNPQGESIENGVAPDIEVHCTPEELAAGKDAILDTAILWLSNQNDQQGVE